MDRRIKKVVNIIKNGKCANIEAFINNKFIKHVSYDCDDMKNCCIQIESDKRDHYGNEIEKYLLFEDGNLKKVFYDGSSLFG